MAEQAKSARGSFPAKLYELVEGHSSRSDEELIVAWCEGGLAFIVRDMTRFCEEVLPQHFCHNKWASFIRQLNLYGFRRITQGPSAGAYWHKYFQRGQPQLLRGITRSRRSAGQELEDDDAFAQHLTTRAPRPGPRSFTHTAPWNANGSVAPMHTGVPLPPALTSFSQLPPPPIIPDEALLRELDSLIQKQKAQHEKSAIPSPASSSNSLQHVRSNTKISAAGLRNAPPITLARTTPTTTETTTDTRKRIASHQSVHSVGSTGEMAEAGGHPQPKRFDAQRSMSKSSLASDEWDLCIGDVDVENLNIDEWRWQDASRNSSRLKNGKDLFSRSNASASGLLNASLNSSLNVSLNGSLNESTA